MSELNAKQLEIVKSPPGACLVLAGAGSGKTRVLTARIAELIEGGISGESILAVTFTNKAAHEMKHRLANRLGYAARHMWVGTFHSLANQMLRQNAAAAGLSPHFPILDPDEQLQVIRRILAERHLSDERWDPKKILGFISRHKDEGRRAAKLPPPQDEWQRVHVELYQAYEQAGRQEGWVDFGELLLRSYELMLHCEEVRSFYEGRFKHFLVDEFQDTNGIQFQWLKVLSKQHHSILVVGDDDQSIYGWRGAKVENIRRFLDEFPNVATIRLEQNYRSTHRILKAANALIEKNSNRMGKTLWTTSADGPPIVLYTAYSEEDEALYVVRQIRNAEERGVGFGEIAVLFRSNAQSRILEEAFLRTNIPYEIYGGLRFFDRAEIKDALSYLRLVVNSEDNAAFERAIQAPSRGLGERTLEKIRMWAAAQAVSLFEAARQLIAEGQQISGKIRNSLHQFLQVVLDLQVVFSTTSGLAQFMPILLQKTGLLEFYERLKSERAEQKLENLKELVSAMADFEQEQQVSVPEAVVQFLAHAALDTSPVHSKTGPSVQLMTMHAAKGLEFRWVFLTGLEESLFPHFFSKDDPMALSEERRLCYVGITRAMEQLYLTWAERRRVFGREEARIQSRFIQEIPQELLEDCSPNVSVMTPPSKKGGAAPFMENDDWLQDTWIGRSVTHPKFGPGLVIDQEGSGAHMKVHVRFKVFGSKWLLLSLSNLSVA